MTFRHEGPRPPEHPPFQRRGTERLVRCTPVGPVPTGVNPRDGPKCRERRRRSRQTGESEVTQVDRRHAWKPHRP
jgi:hypothetical protein